MEFLNDIFGAAFYLFKIMFGNLAENVFVYYTAVLVLGSIVFGFVFYIFHKKL